MSPQSNLLNRLWTFYTLMFLGLWLLASPCTFGFHSQPTIINHFVCGLLLILLSWNSRKHPKAFVIWAIAIIGIWLQFAPLIFWEPQSAAYLDATFVGSCVIVLSVVLYHWPGVLPDHEPQIPPGWSYNPSAWPQRFVIAFLVLICWFIARYLAAYQLGYIQTVWDPFFTPGTESVLTSNISKMFPVSDAGLGALAYTIEFFSVCIGGKNRWHTAPWLVFVFGILVIPVGLVSSILIILQPLSVGTWCTLCLITALSMLIQMPFAMGEVAASIQFLRHSKEHSFFVRLFKGGHCERGTLDKKTPSMEASFCKIIQSSLSGITFPWNLVLSSLLGILLMALPGILQLKGLLYTFDPIFGALTTIVSILAFSEYLRNIRYLNLVCAIALFCISWWSLTHVLFAIVIALLSFRKGPIRETFSYKTQ